MMRGFLILCILLCIPSTMVLSQSNNSISTAIGGIQTDSGYWIVVQTRITLEDNFQYFQDLLLVGFSGKLQWYVKIYETENPLRLNGMYEYENGDILILFEENEPGFQIQQTDILMKVSSLGEVLIVQNAGIQLAGFPKIVADEKNNPEIALIFEFNTIIYTIDVNLQTKRKTGMIAGGLLYDEAEYLDIFSNGTFYLLLSHVLGEHSTINFIEYFLIEPISADSGVIEFNLEGEPIGFVEADEGFLVLGLSWDQEIILLQGINNDFTANPIEIGTNSGMQSPISLLSTDHGYIIFGESQPPGNYFSHFIAPNAEVVGSQVIEVESGSNQVIAETISINSGVLALGMLNNQSLVIKINSQNVVEWYFYYSGQVNNTTSVRTRISFFFPILLIPILARSKKLLTNEN